MVARLRGVMKCVNCKTPVLKLRGVKLGGLIVQVPFLTSMLPLHLQLTQ